MPKLAAVIIIIIMAVSALAYFFMPALLAVANAGKPSVVQVSILSCAADLDARGMAPNPAYANPADTVIWISYDAAPHTVTFGDPSGGVPILDINVIAPGKTFSRAFGDVGAFNYYCAFHPSMGGAVILGDKGPPVLNTPAATDRAFDENLETIKVADEVRAAIIAICRPAVIQVSNPDNAASTIIISNTMIADHYFITKPGT